MQKVALVMRNIYPGVTNESLGLYSLEDALKAVEVYTEQGYKVESSGFMGTPDPSTQGGLGSFRFYWSLVKEDKSKAE